MEVEDRQAHTDHRQWAATEVEGAVDDRHHHEVDGEGEGEGEEEADVVVVVTLDTGRAHTPDLGAGHREGAYHGHPTAVRRQEHHRAEEAAEPATAGETRRREEEEGAVAVEGGARAMIRTTAQGQEAGAEIADSFRLFSWLYSSIR